jgi:hypothetical protein
MSLGTMGKLYICVSGDFDQEHVEFIKQMYRLSAETLGRIARKRIAEVAK